MKHTPFRTVLAIGLFALALSACKPEDIVLGPPPSKLEGIHDTFVLVQVTQVDENASPGTVDELDVTSAFLKGTPPTISFDSDALTFSYAPGSAPDYLGTSGTWAFDDADYPTKVIMNNGVEYDLSLLHTIRPQDQYLEVALQRACGGSTTVTYRYKFQRN